MLIKPPQPKGKLDTVTVNGPEDVPEWDAIDWRVHEGNVGRLRRRIFKATREQDWAPARSLQNDHPQRPRGLLEPCAATGRMHGSGGTAQRCAAPTELSCSSARTAITAGAWANAREAYVAPRRAARRPALARPAGETPRSAKAGRSKNAGRFASGRRSPGPSRSSTSTRRPPTRRSPRRRRPRSAKRSGWRSRLGWGAPFFDVTEALARRAAQVAGEHGLVPWRVAALFQARVMKSLRAHDAAPLLQARELALDGGMLGQVAAIDYVPRRLHLVGSRPSRGPCRWPAPSVELTPPPCALPGNAPFAARCAVEEMLGGRPRASSSGTAARSSTKVSPDAEGARGDRRGGPRLRQGGARGRRPSCADDDLHSGTAGERSRRVQVARGALQRAALLSQLPAMGAWALDLGPAAIGREDRVGGAQLLGRQVSGQPRHLRLGRRHRGQPAGRSDEAHRAPERARGRLGRAGWNTSTK